MHSAKELRARIAIEAVLSDLCRQKCCDVPDIRDVEIRQFCAAGPPSRMRVFRFAVQKMRDRHDNV
tara:strand:+ start:96 stop:293 length:198 start_codon:yes stop_codon:yes gene_type:complete